jgi:hypothetical protein
VKCVVRIIQENYLSESSLDRLRKALRRECKARAVADETLDVGNIRRQIEEVSRRIDNGSPPYPRQRGLGEGRPRSY